MAEVVEFPRHSEMDMPGMLRYLADWLERNPGEFTKVIAILSDGTDGTWPEVYAAGVIENKADIVYQLESAKHSLITYSEKD